MVIITYLIVLVTHAIELTHLLHLAQLALFDTLTELSVLNRLLLQEVLMLVSRNTVIQIVKQLHGGVQLSYGFR